MFGVVWRDWEGRGGTGWEWRSLLGLGNLARQEGNGRGSEGLGETGDDRDWEACIKVDVWTAELRRPLLFLRSVWFSFTDEE